jgi:hypothetical protein
MSPCGCIFGCVFWQIYKVSNDNAIALESLDTIPEEVKFTAQHAYPSPCQDSPEQSSKQL